MNDVVLTLVRRKNHHMLLIEESKFQNKVYLYVPTYVKNKSYKCIQMHRKMSGYHDSGQDSIG